MTALTLSDAFCQLPIMSDDKPETHRFDDPESRLSAEEKDSVSANLPPRAAVLHETIRTQGEEELKRGVSALWWSALAAGLSMGFSMVAKGVLHAHLPPGGINHLISNLGYCVGFIVVIIARQQLFTENTLTAVLPLMRQTTSSRLLKLLRLWGVVLVGNLVGVTLFAAGVAYGDLFGDPVRASFVSLGEEVMKNTAIQMFTKGIVAGWLIATMVWLIPAVHESKIIIITVMTYLIGMASFTHIIAGSTEIAYLVFVGNISAAEGIFRFGLPTLFGNIVGGAFIFALISHAQVRREV